MNGKTTEIISARKELTTRLTEAAEQPIPFLEPVLPPLESLKEDFERIYRSKIYSNGGHFEKQLSTRLSQYLGVRHCIPVANATLGLMIAIKALARPIPRGKVVLPSFTFAATALAVEWAGFEPVFCDIDFNSWQATAELDELLPFRDELALLLVCNTFGAPVDVAKWQALSRTLHVPLLIDSAPGLGATYPDGRRQGQSGEVEVFSMHATKPFSVGEGGVITTDDPGLADRMKRLRNFGFNDARICEDAGMNAKLPEMLAAIGCRVLDGFDQVVAHRRRRAAEFVRALEPLGFVFQRHRACSAFQFVPVMVPPGLGAGALAEWLAHSGIETRRYFSPALHQSPHFAKRSVTRPLENTHRLSQRTLSLPMSNHLGSESVTRICEDIEAFLATQG